jgi:hypothetical protein
MPIVDWKESSKEMRNRLWTIKKLPETKELASKVYEKHGSRKGPVKRHKKKATTTTAKATPKVKTATKSTSKTKPIS